MLRAVAYLHNHRIVHRDIKPANIMLTSKDKNAEFKLSDYGLSLKLENAKDFEEWGGTPNYMAPEFFNDDHKSKMTYAVDVWSLGVLMYELISKKDLFPGNYSYALIDEIKNKPLKFDEPVFTKCK